MSSAWLPTTWYLSSLDLTRSKGQRTPHLCCRSKRGETHHIYTNKRRLRTDIKQERSTYVHTRRPVCVADVGCGLLSVSRPLSLDLLQRQRRISVAACNTMSLSPTRGGCRPSRVPQAARLWNESDARRVCCLLLILHAVALCKCLCSWSLVPSRALAYVRRVV